MKTYKSQSSTSILFKIFIFFFFLGFYFLIGYLSKETIIFRRWTELFGADFIRIISDITRYNSNHFRTEVHPLFVIFLNPIGFLLKVVIGIPKIAAIFLCALFGAGCVVLVQSFFKKLGVQNTHTILYSLVLGFSATHIFFGSLPETGIFAAASIIFIYFIFIDKFPKRFYFILSGIFAFGFLTTNFFQAINAYIFKNFDDKLNRKLFKNVVVYVSLVIALSITLSVLQKVIYPSTSLFFLPRIYKHELSYSISYKNVYDVTDRIILLAENFFIYNFIAPHPHSILIQKDINDDNGRLVANSYYTFFQKESLKNYYKPLGVIGVTMWLLILVLGLYSFLKIKCYKLKIIKCLLFGLFFNFSLHLVYGFNEEIFLYSGNWTFLSLALIFLTIQQNKQIVQSYAKLYSFLLIIFIIILFVNNIHFLYNCIVIQDGNDPIFSFYPFVKTILLSL